MRQQERCDCLQGCPRVPASASASCVVCTALAGSQHRGTERCAELLNMSWLLQLLQRSCHGRHSMPLTFTTPFLQRYRLGQRLRARVLGFRPMDGLAALSLKPSIVDQNILSLAGEPGLEARVFEAFRGFLGFLETQACEEEAPASAPALLTASAIASTQATKPHHCCPSQGPLSLDSCSTPLVGPSPCCCLVCCCSPCCSSMLLSPPPRPAAGDAGERHRGAGGRVRPAGVDDAHHPVRGCVCSYRAAADSAAMRLGGVCKQL